MWCHFSTHPQPSLSLTLSVTKLHLDLDESFKNDPLLKDYVVFSCKDHGNNRAAELFLSFPMFFIQPRTFQSEDAITQGIHNVVKCGFIGHIEKVLVVRVAGDVFDL